MIESLQVIPFILISQGTLIADIMKMKSNQCCNAFAIAIFLINHTYAQQHTIGELKGRYKAKQLHEISGIAASNTYPNTFYIHNDSGDSSRFFSVNENGDLKATYYFEGEDNSFLGVRDCEDIAVGPGPEKGKQYIYLADIGDNAAMRSEIHIFRFEEPAADSGTITTIAGKMFTMIYPNGAQDAETLMIDPKDELLYIVSKRQKAVAVYTAPLDLSENSKVMLQQTCKLHFNGKKHDRWIVGGCISQDGKQVVIKSTKKVYYWQRMGNEPLYITLQRTPNDLPYTQNGQEEAICFSPDGKSYYVTGEGQNAGIYQYEIPGRILALLKK